MIATAASHGLLVSVAVVDRGGDPIHQDRMDDGAPAGVDVALASAATAARFGCASGDVAARYGDATAALGALHPSPFLAAPGGVPIVVDGRVVGAVGVGGAKPGLCAAMALEASAS